jgi:hypothetical protein
VTRGEALAWGRGDRTRIDRRDVPAEVLALVTERMGGEFCEDCRALKLETPADVPIELDHKQALAAGGDNHHANLRWACRSHNRGRGSRSITEPVRAPRWHRRRRTP